MAFQKLIVLQLLVFCFTKNIHTAGCFNPFHSSFHFEGKPSLQHLYPIGYTLIFIDILIPDMV